jgi:hypothetical protein
MEVTISLTMEDQGGNRHGRQKRAYIGFPSGSDEGGDLIRASGESLRPGPPGSEALVGDPAGSEDPHPGVRAPSSFMAAVIRSRSSRGKPQG